MVFRNLIISTMIFVILAGQAYADTKGDKVESNSSLTVYVDSIVEKAFNKRLYEDPYWVLLLHYKRGFLGNRSLIDDPSFFLSAEGKYDLKKEMEATIRAFFRPVDKTFHSALKFAARYEWLRENLEFDESKVPVDARGKFEAYYKKLDPANILLIFPAGYIESPASMFGHTLMILEPRSGDRLNSMAVNYAARTDETFGLIFAFKGLFGLYDGYFSFLTYAEKINEYNNGEMRDIWEYRLNLNEKEIKRLVRHMVEIEGIRSNYYFFDENCSYNLLYMLEIARPSKKLTSGYFFTAEPIDTVRSVIWGGLVTERVYRPSLYSKIHHIASELSVDQKKAVIETVKGKNETFEFADVADKNIKARMYDLCGEYLRFLYTKDDIEKPDYTKRFVSVLRKRSEIPVKDDYMSRILPPTAPETSLMSRKVSLSGGSYDHNSFVQLSFRPSCHELMDADKGLTENSEIVFGNTAVRYYPEEKEFELQRFDLIKILSLPASDMFYLHRGLKLSTGLEQTVNPLGENHLSWYLDTGLGVSTRLSFLGQIYFFAENDLNFSNEFRYNTFNDAGLKTGLLTPITGRFKNYIYAKYGHTLFGDKSHLFEWGVQQRFEVVEWLSVYGEYSQKTVFRKKHHEFSASVSVFY